MKIIFLPILLRFLAGPVNFAVMVLLCAVLHPTVVARIRLLTDYHILTGVFEAPVVTIIAVLWGRCVGKVILTEGVAMFG